MFQARSQRFDAADVKPPPVAPGTVPSAKATPSWKVPARPEGNRGKKRKLDSPGGPNASLPSAPSPLTPEHTPDRCTGARKVGSEERGARPRAPRPA